jgi:hypothetical protein
MQGINFIEPLFHKVVSGEKGQTRRIIKPQPECDIYQNPFGEYFEKNKGDKKEFKPRYKPGETLYLKEPYKVKHAGLKTFDIELQYSQHTHFYVIDKFDTDMKGWVEKRLIEQNYSKTGYCNKLFMPEFCAKNFIEITGVRAEQLLHISDKDCIKEGITYWDGKFLNIVSLGSTNDFIEYNTPRDAYAALIDSIHKKGVWESNPFVWCYDFKLTNKTSETK